MVTDRAGGQLHAVADDVVLEGQDVERVLGLQRLEAALRHREGIMAELHLAGVVELEHREIDDPAEAEGVLLQKIERSEEHTSELQSLMRISYAVFCLQTQNTTPRSKLKTSTQITSQTYTPLQPINNDM